MVAKINFISTCVKRSISHIFIPKIIFGNRIITNYILKLRKLSQRAFNDPFWTDPGI